MTTQEPIAIVATACRLPGGATDSVTLVEQLCERLDPVREIPRQRWQGLDFSRLDDPSFASRRLLAGLLDDVESFDLDAFGMGTSEVRTLDPQQRLALELAWEGFERAGLDARRLTQDRTGVFMGVGNQDYLFSALLADPHIGMHVATGNARNMIANRVSYAFDLTGPSVAVDTACSSSLVAVHLAASSLRAADCDTALAGGVNLILAPVSTSLTGRSLPLSPSGRCRTFDADADGIVRGEGGGVVVLRRLSDARRDGDPILAVLHATVSNQDGATNGITAPSPKRQRALLEDAVRVGGFDPADVGFAELHGTGTALGDPIEVGAIRAVYGADPETAGPCWLGSVKANLGHLESAAGIASLIKAVGVIESGLVPPQLHVETLNPRLALDGTRFVVPDRVVELASGALVTVSSFGFGGANAHTVLGPPPEPAAPARPVASTATAATDANGVTILPLSARSADALRELGAEVAGRLREGADVGALAAAAARGRTAHPYRLAVTGTTADELATALEQRAGNVIPVDGRQRIAFVYTGQLSQWAGMGEPLWERSAAARAELEAWDDELKARGGPSLLTQLTSEDLLEDTRVAQLSIVAVQAAATAAWAELGVVPDVVCGHSVGEVAAALAAGALDRAGAIDVVVARGGVLHRTARGGRMAVLHADPTEVTAWLRHLGRPALGIAAANGPRSTVVAGPLEAWDGVDPQASGLAVTWLPGDYAFHAPGLASVGAEVAATLAGLRAAAPQRRFVSSVTGTTVTDVLDGQYWARNVTGTVRFTDAVDTLIEDHRVGVALEIGPHPALVTHVEAVAARLDRRVVTAVTQRRGQRGGAPAAESISRLWATGCDIDFTPLFPTRGQPSLLPTYPWQRTRITVADRPDLAVPASPIPAGGSAVPEQAPAAPSQVPVAPAARTGAQPGDEDLKTSPAALLTFLEQTLREVLGPDELPELDVDVPARDLDIDSAVFVELKNRVEDAFGVPVPVTALLDGSSLRTIATRLTAPEAPTEDDDLLDRLDHLSEDEIDRLLAKELSREDA